MRLGVVMVFALGCSSSSAPPPLREYTETTEAGGCVVTGYRDQPYAYDCGVHYRMSGTVNEDPTDKSKRHFAVVDGACFARPVACHDKACLGGAADCPPPPSTKPLAVQHWDVVRTGDRCKITPQPPTHLSPPEPPYEIACPEGYEAPIESVERDEIKDHCNVESGEECPPGALCEPEHRTAVCPRRP